MQSIDLPNKTGGYQRPGMAIMAGNTAGNGTPSGTLAPSAVYLVSKAMGQLGGNNITAEFKAPAAGTLNAPLSIAVTDGTWRTYDQNDADASNGITEITIPTKDIVVTLATDANGALSSTSKQVVDAINADPAASALVTASTYLANAGTGIVPATGRADLPGRRTARPTAELLVDQGQALGLPARRHGLLGRQLRDGHPADARPHGRAPRAEGPVQPEGLPDHQRGQPRRGQDRHLHLLRAARP